MKHFIRYLYVLSALLLSSSGAWADGVVNIITQVNGVVSADGGQVTAEVVDGTCTLTVTPAKGYFMATDHIKVMKILAGNVAQSRRQVPALADDIPLTPLNVDDPSGTTTYIFLMPESPYDVEVTADFQKMFIPPIVGEGDEKDGIPTTDVTYELVDFTDLDGNPIDLSNVTIENVLYTLPDDDPTHPQGFDPGTTDGHPGIVLATSMTEDDIARADGETPGTNKYAESFKGITLLLPAGTGLIHIVAQTDPGAVLCVKIGDNEPMLFPNVNFEDDIWVPYACPRNTYVKIYLAPKEAGSRRKKSPFRDKRETTTVKVTGISVTSSSLITPAVTAGQPTQVKVFDLMPNNFAHGGLGIVLATVCDQPVNALGSNVFGSVEDKDHIGYIDMSGSAIQGLGSGSASRSESNKVSASGGRLDGLLNGFSDHTLVFLPEGNNDGGDCNIIINGTCNNLSLDDNYTFCTPRDFTAASVSLGRTFTAGRATTLMLPFDISTFDANALGTFHRFSKMENNTVLFDEAEVGAIEANTPYIFVPEATELTAHGVDVKAIDDDNPVLSDIFFGTYTRQMAPARTFGFTPATDANGLTYGKFLPLAGDDMLQPFSAYLRVDGEATALYMVIGKDIPTGIETVNTIDIRSMALYNLGGQRVSHPRKGLYVANGRKIVFK